MSHSSHSSKGAFQALGSDRVGNGVLQTLSTLILPFVLFVFGTIWGGRCLAEISRVNTIKNMPPAVFLRAFEKTLPEKASQKRLIAISDYAMNSDPFSLNIAKRATLAANAHKKSCLPCQTRLTYIDILQNGNLTSSGQSSLLHSYEISLYGKSDLMKWRLNVSSLYWGDLSIELQTYALMQITGLSANHGGRQWLKRFDTNVDAIHARIIRLQ